MVWENAYSLPFFHPGQAVMGCDEPAGGSSSNADLILTSWKCGSSFFVLLKGLETQIPQR